MRLKSLFRKPFVLILLMLAACQSTGILPARIMLKPGDSIHGLTLTKGAAEAVPLWAFCSPPQQSEHIFIVECHIPLSTKLAIGQVFFPVDKVLVDLDRSKLVWELSIDGRTLDLDAFGTYDYVSPAISDAPCPIREVFIKSTSPDIVLNDLKPGIYTLQAMAQAETETYTWVINLVIEQL